MNDSLPALTPCKSLFFTARLSDRSSDLLIRDVACLRAATRETRTRLPFTIDAIVILPATVCAVVTLPPGVRDFDDRWLLLKSLFARRLPAASFRSRSQMRRGRRGLWLRPHKATVMVDEDDRASHVDLVHGCPVYMGLCRKPQDWAHSSVHRQHMERRRQPDVLTTWVADPALIRSP